MKNSFSLGKWFIVTGIFTLLATYIMNNQTLAAPDNQDIRIRKITENTEERPGISRLVLLDEDNNRIEEFDVETNVGYTTVENIKPGKYKLKEIKTPDGYAFGTDLIIDVLDSEEVQTFDFMNIKSDNIKLSLMMRDIALSTLVDDSRVQLLNSDNEVIDTCDSAYYTPCIFQDLDEGEYTLKETNTPPGYISMEDINFVVTTDDIGKTIEIEKTRDFTRLEICKIDTSSGEQLPNAVFELYNEDGDLFDRWTTDEYVKYIERIPIGTYTLKEISPPPGYATKNEQHTIFVTETPEIVYINAYNSPTIEVPNTAIYDSVIFYFIGGFLLTLGVIVMTISYRKNYKR